MARPKKKIDKEQFEKLCALACTLIEIAGFFDCSEDTIENWCKRTYKRRFSDVFKVKRGAGNISLRRKQMEVAMNGNPAMLIFLGKNRLDQSDKREVEHAIESKEFILKYSDQLESDSE